MERHSRLFLPAQGHERIALYIWRPASSPRAALQFVHGMREHMGRYDEYARLLADSGFIVYGHDHMGHGLTTADGEITGYFGKKDGPELLLRDCRAVTDKIKQDCPGLPIFLHGHSMGSFISRMYALRAGGELAGYICMATGGPMRVKARAGIAVASVLSAMRGTKKGSVMDILTFGRYNARFPERTRLAWLSRDMDAITAYKADPLIVPRFTYPAFRDLIRMQAACNRRRWFAAFPKELPVLLISGGDDPVGGYGSGLRAVDKALRGRGVRDVTLKLYDGARHELLFEHNRGEVQTDILAWLEKRMP